MRPTNSPLYNLRRGGVDGLETVHYPTPERLQADALAAGLPLIRAVHICLGTLDQCGVYPFVVRDGIIEWERGEPPCLRAKRNPPSQGAVTALTGHAAAQQGKRTPKRKPEAPSGPGLFDNLEER